MAAAAAGLRSCSSSTSSPERHRRSKTPTSPPPHRLPRRLPAAPKQQPLRSPPAAANKMVAPVLSSHMELRQPDKARALFDQLEDPDTFLWNVMIRGCVGNGLFEDAAMMFVEMFTMGVGVDCYTLPFVAKACAEMGCVGRGRMVHGVAVKVGLDGNVFVCNALVAMYGKVGRVGDAEMVFDGMPERDSVSWNSMVNAYLCGEDGWSALGCFGRMVDGGMEVDRFGLLSALAACALESCLSYGREVHCYVLRHGFEVDSMVQTSVVDMYGKCGDMDSAEKIFGGAAEKSTVAWNALIGAYGVNDQPDKSLQNFIRMQEDESVKPDAITLMKILAACAQLNDALKVMTVHGYALRRWFLPNGGLERILIEVYASCGKIMLAETLFELVTEKNLVTCNIMISTYAHNGYNLEAIKLFRDLSETELEPDEFTKSSIVPAYGEIRSLRPGRQIHAYVMKCGFGTNLFISNSLIYMYAKCGDLESSQKIFDHLLVKDTVSWNTIIMAYGIHGFGRKSLELFSQMQDAKFEPNRVTLISVLTSCSTSGLIDEGWKHFDDMTEKWNIDPQIEHYGSVIDLLGRSGNLESVLQFINKMPLPPTARIWGSLLTASRNNHNIKFAEIAAEHILPLNHDNTGCYVLLCNMYADAQRWEDVDRINSLMKAQGIDKSIGRCTVELNNRTYSFINGDKSHPKTHAIHKAMEALSRFIGEPVSNSNVKFRPEEEVKKAAKLPRNHCFRLALAYGLITSEIGTPILIKKNIRLCESCHTAAKFVSRYSHREIIVGDSAIYHHFKDGECTCRDYW